MQTLVSFGTLALGILLDPTLVTAAILSKDAAIKTIEKDVVIIGGGASGAHAAVRLREDFGKSVIIVEKQNNLVRRYIEVTRACVKMFES
jgi:heterodisulfide reductase subunit A-like polyferredoxin